MDAVIDNAKPSPLVLIIDDEPSARSAISRVLERKGYRTLVAGDGNEGLDLFDRHTDEIQLVVLDWHLPGLSGKKTLQDLLVRRPGLRVVLVTGDPEADFDPDVRESAACLLLKPFTPTELVLAVSALLPA